MAGRLALLSRAPFRARLAVPKFSGSTLILAIVVLTSVALGLIGVTNALRTRETAIERAELSTQNTASLFEQQLVRVLDIVSVLWRMAAPSDIAPAPGDRWLRRQLPTDPANAVGQLAAIARDLPYIRAVRVLDAKTGVVVLDATPGPVFRTPVPAVADAEALAAASSASESAVHVGRPFLLAGSKADYTVAISRRVTLPGRPGPFVAIVHLDLGSLQSVLDQIDVGPRGAVAILRSDGTLIARKPFDVAIVGQDVSRGPVFDALRQVGPAGSVLLETSLDGVRRVASYRRMRDYPLLVVAAVEEADVLAEWRASLLRQGGLVFSAILVVALLGLSLAREIRRREAETARVRDNEVFLRSVFEGSGDCIEVLDADGRIEFINAAGQLAFGARGPDDLKGTPLVELLSPTAQAAVRGALEIARSGEAARFTVPGRDGAGAFRWWDMAITAMGGGGRVERFVAVGRDMSERMRTEEELRAAKRTADAAIQAKTDFLAAISHELRTPLNGILNVTEMLMKAPRDRREHDLLRIQRDAGRQLLGVIGNVIDWTRIEDDHLDLADDVVDPRDIAQTCVGLLDASAAAKGLSLVASVDDDVPLALRSDRLRLQQIILNYLANAVKFTEHGRVTLTLRRRVDRLRVSVSDTGSGIPDNKQHLLFQKFSQIEQGRGSAREGSGLGLAITKRIVEALGGTVGVSSTSGVGSTFWFEISLREALPAGDSASVVHEPAPTIPLAAAAPRASRILLAEDVAFNQIIFRLMLEDEAFEVDVVDDGEEALRSLDAAVYDLLILDVQMPRLSGVDATRAIRARPDALAAIPIIGLTANVLPDQLATYLQAGMNRCLTKPVDRLQLVESIRDLLSGRTSHGAPEIVGMGSWKLFDETVVLDLQERIGVAKIDALFEIFQRTTRENFDALAHADPARQAEGLHQLTHSLVSTAGTFGFEAVSRESRAIMEGQRTGHVQTLAADLRGLVDRSMAAWAASRDGRSASTTLSAA